MSDHETPAPRGNQPPGRKSADRPPPPIVAYEDVTASCGHPEKFGLFADRLDRFRKDRRKKVLERPCKACREQQQREEQEAVKARREQKQQRAAQAAAAGQTPNKRANARHERLPNGSKVEAVYDAGRTQWNGTLTVQGSVFIGSAGTLLTLLGRLDRQYRQTLREPSAEPGA